MILVTRIISLTLVECTFMSRTRAVLDQLDVKRFFSWTFQFHLWTTLVPFAELNWSWRRKIRLFSRTPWQPKKCNGENSLSSIFVVIVVSLNFLSIALTQKSVCELSISELRELDVVRLFANKHIFLFECVGYRSTDWVDLWHLMWKFWNLWIFY